MDLDTDYDELMIKFNQAYSSLKDGIAYLSQQQDTFRGAYSLGIAASGFYEIKRYLEDIDEEEECEQCH